ncbi:MAG: DUF692 family multinuclear iron-containing protein [Rickettsiaceae bacterium]
MNSLLGVGLRKEHYNDILSKTYPIEFLEVHSENFINVDSKFVDLLIQIGKHYKLSLHGIGLSLGSKTLDNQHLKSLKTLINQVEPFLVSEHLSWNKFNGKYIPDLIPIPYTTESLGIFVNNVTNTQEFLERQILIENPSSYMRYKCDMIQEADFLVEIAFQSGAGILLDINNIYVSSHNNDFNPKQYIDKIDKNLVKEIHLAGHSHKQIAKNKVLKIDTHDDFICDEVWELYEYAIKKFGPVYSLFEWDENAPELSVLINEIQKAKKYLFADRKCA